jgi:hypothetical protein
MTDSVGLLHSFPITGSELLTIEFTTPGRESYKTILHTINVGEVQSNDNQTKHGYILKCISPEKLFDSINQVEKGYNTTIDMMIQDIIKCNLMSQKKLIYEPTRGVQLYVPPYTSPFKIIDSLRSRAGSTTNKSSSYLFFENKHGYNLNTLEYLMAKNTSAVGDKVFTAYTATAVELQAAVEFRTIHSYNIGRQFDIHGAMNIGALNNIHQSFDILTKTLTENTYTIDQFPQFSSTSDKGSSPFTPPLINKYGQSDAVKYFSVHDSAKPDTGIAEFLPQKIGFMSVALGSSISIYINGDSSVSAGDAIKIEIPVTSGLTRTQIEPEKLINGIYICKEVHHRIMISSATPKYTQSLTLIRGTYQQ